MTIHAAELIEGVATLMSLPAAYLNVKRVVEDPRSSTSELAKAIGSDPALTARLLRLVNSPLYGFSSRIETISRALVVLGTQQVHDLALATAVANLFAKVSPNQMDMERFWRESVYCSLSARAIAKLCNLLDSERLFVAGLLHQIGHLVMYQRIPEQAAAARRHSEMLKVSLHQAERELIGCDYAQVGAALMRRWNLSTSLCAAIEHHVEPDRAPPPALVESILHMAHWHMVAVLEGSSQEEWARPIAGSVWSVTGLTPECFTPIKVQSDAQFAETLAMLSSAGRAA